MYPSQVQGSSFQTTCQTLFLTLFELFCK
jgi:hypothetical protein